MFKTRHHRTTEWRARTRRKHAKWRIAAAVGVLGLIAVAFPALAKRGDEGCAKIENQAIGAEGVELTVGDTTVTFTDWTAKDGESREYVGFDFSTDSGHVQFTVKAGQDRTPHGPSSSGSFALNESADGRLRAISHVEVCPATVD